MISSLIFLFLDKKQKWGTLITAKLNRNFCVRDGNGGSEEPVPGTGAKRSHGHARLWLEFVKNEDQNVDARGTPKNVDNMVYSMLASLCKMRNWKYSVGTFRANQTEIWLKQYNVIEVYCRTGFKHLALSHWFWIDL